MKITGGNATVMVADMDRAVEFYTRTLGLALRFRAGSEWAEVEAGGGFVIGLHPAGPKGPAPGPAGGVSIGFGIEGSIEEAVADLAKRGVRLTGPVSDNPDEPVRIAPFADPDGTPLYLCETKRC